GHLRRSLAAAAAVRVSARVRLRQQLAAGDLRALMSRLLYFARFPFLGGEATLSTWDGPPPELAGARAVVSADHYARVSTPAAEPSATAAAAAAAVPDARLSLTRERLLLRRWRRLFRGRGRRCRRGR